ncbi:Nucleolar protein 9 [Rhodotorula toruloides]
MPRPRQRKSANSRKEEKKLKKEQEEREAAAQLAREKRERERKTRMDWDGLPTTGGDPSSSRPVDPDALPEPDPDTKAYFKRISEQIEEMSANGFGKRETQIVVNEDGEEVEEEIEDERPLLLRSALESLSGHEVALAGDHETSVVLEQLLYAMDDFAKRVLLDRFTGMYDKLVKHRHASHVLQTLFELAGETVDRETRGNIATGPSSASADSLPTMSALLVSCLTELLPNLPSLIYDPFASHCIRILLLAFSGVPASSTDPAARSKKSAQFRRGQGKATLGKNWLADDVAFTKEKDGGKGKGKGKGRASAAEQRFATPSEFHQVLQDMYERLDALDLAGVDPTTGHALPTASIPGDGVRRAAMHEVAGPVMRILVELEALEPNGGWKAGGWADRVLCGLVSEVASGEVGTANTAATSDLREEYLAGLLRHPASSPTFEMLLTLAPKPVFDALWSTFFAQKLHRLAANAVANFVVAVGVARVDEKQLDALVKELRGIAEERRGEWIDNYRTGVLRALMESASRLGASEAEVSELMLDTFGLRTEEERKLVMPCVLTLNRLTHWKKLANGATPEPTTQGSVLLQTWLKMHSPHNQVVLDSITALPFDSLLAISRSATSSRVLDVLLTSSTVPPRALRTLILSLLGHFHTLADDRIGSRVAERCFASADVYLKDKIAQSLFDKQNDLQRSAWAHFFARKLELPLWGRKREEWKAKMAQRTNEEKARLRAEEEAAKASAQPQAQEEQPATQEKKKRERKADEVDEIFAPAASGKKAKASGDGERKAKKAKMDREERDVGGLEDVLSAIKASV